MSEFRVEINPLLLDEELVDQPKLYHKWAVKCADAQADLDKAKSYVDVVRSEIDLDIRSNPEGYGIKKVTENTISSTINVSPVYIKAVEEASEANHTLQIHKAAVVALEHRKRSLSLLVELWIRDYYSSMNSRPQGPEAEDDRHEARSRGRKRQQEKEQDERIDD